MQITLTATAGPHAGQVFRFTGHDRFLVGRSARAHFRLQHEPGQDRDRYVSRLHFLVEVNPPLCRLIDVGSRNGTFVNGGRIGVCDLRHGDEIRAGHTTLRVELHEAPPPTDAYLGQTFSGVHGTPVAKAVRSGNRLSPVEGACPVCRQPRADADRPVCPGCLEQAASQPQPVPGYLLLGELGRGGMGAVHLALPRQHNTLVAVKTIFPAGVASAELIDRFLREADILRELDHPHIVRFLEMGSAKGQLYLVMEYVPGTDAARALGKQSGLPLRPALRLMNQLLLALEYAHDEGFVHRDVKPANLLLHDRAGRKVLKVADFGLARVYEASALSGLTLAGQFGGTFGYMPPEQITSFRDVRPASDQYAAAATLYHLLTGEMAHDFPADPGGQIGVILNQDPVPIRSRRPDLPEALAGPIHRALARDPADRFPDVGAFRQALLPFTR